MKKDNYALAIRIASCAISNLMNSTSLVALVDALPMGDNEQPAVLAPASITLLTAEVL
jgi:hypothetical protein